jgi:hypothetical protein
VEEIAALELTRTKRLTMMMKKRVCSLALILLAMATLQSGEVWAQESEPPVAVRHQLGPVIISPTITLRDLGVDTNVYNDDSPNPAKDFAFTLVPAFTATVGRRRATLNLRSATELVYFAEQRSERSVNEDLAATARFTLGRIVPTAEFGYLNTRERVSQEIDVRARRIEQRGAVGMEVVLTRKIAAQVRGELWRIEFDGDDSLASRQLARELNRDTPAVSAAVRYAVTPLTAFAVTTEVSRSRFREAPIRDTDSRQMLFGVELHPRALISGSARVGYQSFQPLSAAVPDFSGLVGSANLVYRFRATTSLGFSFDRNVSYSYLPVEPYYVREGYGLLVRRQIVPQWDLTVSGERYRHDYRRLLEGDSLSGHFERVVGATVALGYDLGPRTRFTTGLSYQYRQSDFEERSYDGLRVGTSVAYGF